MRKKPRLRARVRGDVVNGTFTGVLLQRVQTPVGLVYEVALDWSSYAGPRRIWMDASEAEVSADRVQIVSADPPTSRPCATG